MVGANVATRIVDGDMVDTVKCVVEKRESAKNSTTAGGSCDGRCDPDKEHLSHSVYHHRDDNILRGDDTVSTPPILGIMGNFKTVVYKYIHVSGYPAIVKHRYRRESDGSYPITLDIGRGKLSRGKSHG